ncbi:hypothetical protein CLOSYM_04642 [[Clostridium] symbiosum ATCC 14940]|uniref:Uncharacterized protein n=1 Tax=[Clostridium] symbiosum ATCC 14940 TaxID=411472 RepID=A0ABC9TR88_CLOSY|nr:hypothetical protein CLOSYM_04642 [[Clostridium] symbiosum ATCC 14940]
MHVNTSLLLGVPTAILLYFYLSVMSIKFNVSHASPHSSPAGNRCIKN